MGIKKSQVKKVPWGEQEVLLVNGVRVRKAFLFGLGLPLILSLLAVFAVTTYVILATKKAGGDDPVDVSISERKVSEIGETGSRGSRTAGVLHRVLEANGLSGCESLIIEGTYETLGTEFSLSIFAKYPDLFRQTLRRGDMKISSAWDGRRYWEENPASKLGDRAVVRHAINLAMLKLQASPAALVWQHQQTGASSFQWVESGKIDGRVCDILRNNGLLEVPVRHFIDSETGLELRREAIIAIEAEEMKIILEFNYTPQDVVGDSTRRGVPTGYDLYLNELQIAEARFRDLRVDSGLMPWMFESTRP